MAGGVHSYEHAVAQCVMTVARLVYPFNDEAMEFSLARFMLEAYRQDARFKYPHRWRWLYRQDAVSLIVFEDQSRRIVGHLGCVPFVARHNGVRVLGAWSLDLYVLSQFRCRGYARALQSTALSLNSILASYAYSATTKRIKTSIGLQPVATVWILRRRCDRQDVRSRMNTTSPNPDEISKQAMQYLSVWDFWIERSPLYCAWRFCEQPNAGYKQIVCDDGLALIRLCGPHHPGWGMIGDAFPAVRSTDCLMELVNTACGALAEEGCTVVRFATTDVALVERLMSRQWAIAQETHLFVQPGAIRGRVFLSLSDQDGDQYPS